MLILYLNLRFNIKKAKNIFLITIKIFLKILKYNKIEYKMKINHFYMYLFLIIG